MIQLTLVKLVCLVGIVFSVIFMLAFLALLAPIKYAIWPHPLNIWGYVWLMVDIGLVVGLLYTLFNTRFRTRWIFVYENVPPQTRLVLRRVWRERGTLDKKIFTVMYPGWVAWIPLAWIKDGADAIVSMQPQIFNQMKFLVNTADGAQVLIVMQVTSCVDENDENVINFFLNIRKPEEIKGIINAHLHYVMCLVASSNKPTETSTETPWKCDAYGMVCSNHKQIKSINLTTSCILTQLLKEGGFGLSAYVTLQNIMLTGFMLKARENLLVSGVEAEANVRRAEGYAEAIRIKGEGLSQSLENIVRAGGDKFNPTWYALGESLATNIGIIIMDVVKRTAGNRTLGWDEKE